MTLSIIDTIIYLAILIFKRKWLDNISQKIRTVVMATSVALFFLNLACRNRSSELLTRTFDHKYLVKYLGPYNFTVYDGVKQSKIISKKH